jgi:hypothetical protein
MVKANNKEELIENSQIYFEEIIEFINDLPDELKIKEYLNNELNERDKTIGDVLCHLHEWHLMMESWYKIGLKGETPATPMEGYNWKQLTAVNAIIHEKYKGTELNEAIKLFKNSHKKLMKIIERHENKELYETILYKWTGKHTLGNFIDSNTSSHYQWGLETLKKINKKTKRIKNK